MKSNLSVSALLKSLWGISLLLLVFTSANAQKIQTESYPKIFAKVDSCINNYIRLSKLVDKGDDEINLTIVEEFKTLFTADAMISDEICPKYFDGIRNLCTAYEYVDRNLNDYILMMQNHVPKGIRSNVLNASISYDYIAEKKVKVVLEKTNSAYYKNLDLWMKSACNVELELLFDKGFNKVLISSVKILTPNNEKKIPGYSITDDMDMDYISDSKDNCKRYPGMNSSDGCPDRSEIALIKECLAINLDPRLVLDVTAMGGLSTPNGTFSELSYDRLSQFDAQNILPDPTIKWTSFGAAAEVSYFLGTQRKIGIGSGVHYLLRNGTLTSDSLRLNYRRESNLGSYQQIFSAGAIEEEIKSTSISIPVLARFRGQISNKLSYDASAGALFGLSFSGTSTPTQTSFNYEAIFKMNASGKVEFPDDGTPASQLVYATESNTNQFLDFPRFDGQTSALTTFEIYQSQQDLNLGLRVNNNPENTVKEFSFKPSVGFMGRANVLYKLSNAFSLQLGALFSYQKQTNAYDLKTYRISDSLGSYNTLMNGFQSISTMNIIVNFGIRYSLKSN
jgi:hypothetical protein